MLDHSAIYKSRSILHWHHRSRLRLLLREVANYREAASVADIGCSNGYLTNILNEVCAGEVQGFDYLPELVESARASYPEIVFQRADLNRVIKWERRYELVCCFETLEHVGDLTAALRNIHAALSDGGTLIVTVPVETGLWGLTKYCAKSLARYPMDEIDASRVEYGLALLKGQDISHFRKEAYTWGTHFGFDWRALEDRISTMMKIEKAYTRFATRFIVAIA
jgi:2-polyprenyl-3-methyl-5-hydroxy-6-metoxy-1,4-benzoquinol methylase